MKSREPSEIRLEASRERERERERERMSHLHSEFMSSPQPLLERHPVMNHDLLVRCEAFFSILQ
jgi:hypothetical protein